MKRQRYKNHTVLARLIPGLAIFIITVCAVCNGFRSAESAAHAEELRIAKDSINRAVAVCYAIECRYPPDYEYLRDNYGIGIDEDMYAVHYEVFAENIMPEITIVKRQGEYK